MAPLLGEGAVDSTLLDRAVAELNRRCGVKGLETIREIGEYVLAAFFDGEPESSRNRGNGHIALRQLGERDQRRRRPRKWKVRKGPAGGAVIIRLRPSPNYIPREATRSDNAN